MKKFANKKNRASERHLLPDKNFLIFTRWVLLLEWKKKIARYDLTENLLILKCDLLVLPFPVATLRADFFSRQILAISL